MTRVSGDYESLITQDDLPGFYASDPITDIPANLAGRYVLNLLDRGFVYRKAKNAER